MLVNGSTMQTAKTHLRYGSIHSRLKVRRTTTKEVLISHCYYIVLIRNKIIVLYFHASSSGRKGTRLEVGTTDIIALHFYLCAVSVFFRRHPVKEIRGFRSHNICHHIQIYKTNSEYQQR